MIILSGVYMLIAMLCFGLTLSKIRTDEGADGDFWIFLLQGILSFLLFLLFLSILIIEVKGMNETNMSRKQKLQTQGGYVRTALCVFVMLILGIIVALIFRYFHDDMWTNILVLSVLSVLSVLLMATFVLDIKGMKADSLYEKQKLQDLARTMFITSFGYLGVLLLTSLVIWKKITFSEEVNVGVDKNYVDVGNIRKSLNIPSSID